MGQPQSRSPTPNRRIRRDGWTVERQLAFLAALAETRSATRAAAAAGMSRESAYRLRERPAAALFAALWDGALRPEFGNTHEGHAATLSNGRLLRLLSNHFRRERGDFSAIGATAGMARRK